VIVPRSHIAELLEDALAPWIEDPRPSNRRSTCAPARAASPSSWPCLSRPRVDAVDISADALEVAAATSPTTASKTACAPSSPTSSPQPEEEALRPDHLQPALRHRRQPCDALPAEYRHEPALALAAGEDGLDVVRRILSQAHKYLKPHGVLAIEVGHNQDLVTAAFPELPAVWIDTANTEGKVFVLTREDLSGS
jgi:ribosomal protein L3 glutamine methyltransferase